MEKNINRQAPPAEQADIIENASLNESPENGILKLEDLPSFPEDPENEDSFRDERIATEEEGTETAPLSKDRDNDYYHETTGILPNNENKPGDKVDEDVEQLGQNKERAFYDLDARTYESIPKKER